MNTLRTVVTLRYLFTATGVVAILMQMLHPVWNVELAGGQTTHPRPWAWQQPDLSLASVTSSTIDWWTTLGPALGMAVCTFLWWRIGGRDVQRLDAGAQGAMK